MSSQPRERPNFVVILSDQHNAGFMGCAGNEIVRTPHPRRRSASQGAGGRHHGTGRLWFGGFPADT